jgi:hypothetical protein
VAGRCRAVETSAPYVRAIVPEGNEKDYLLVEDSHEAAILNHNCSTMGSCTSSKPRTGELGAVPPMTGLFAHAVGWFDGDRGGSEITWNAAPKKPEQLHGHEALRLPTSVRWSHPR